MPEKAAAKVIAGGEEKEACVTVTLVSPESNLFPLGSVTAPREGG